MVHVVKIYFEDLKNGTQIRRLVVNNETVTKYDLLAQKIRNVFAPLENGNLELTWKDDENDNIHISSDVELAQALANAVNGLLKIYVFSPASKTEKEYDKPTTFNDLHEGVICNGCDKTIQGTRYNFLRCYNYDLCSACNAENKHDHHDMLKYSRSICGGKKRRRSMFNSSYIPSDKQQSESSPKVEPSPKAESSPIVEPSPKAESLPKVEPSKRVESENVNWRDVLNNNLTGIIKARSAETYRKRAIQRQEKAAGINQNNLNTHVKTNERSGIFKVVPTSVAVAPTPTKAAQAETTGDWLIVSEQDIEKNEVTAMAPQNDLGAKPNISIFPTKDQVLSMLKGLAEMFLAKDDSALMKALMKPSENIPNNDGNEIMNVLTEMQSMGFTNEGGWLEQFLISKRRKNISDLSK